MEGIANEQFETVLEMIIKIIEKAETRDEAVKEVKELVEKKPTE